IAAATRGDVETEGVLRLVTSAELAYCGVLHRLAKIRDAAVAVVVVTQCMRPGNTDLVEELDCFEADLLALVVIDEVAGVHQKVGLLFLDQATNLAEAAAVVNFVAGLLATEVRIGELQDAEWPDHSGRK